MKKTALNQISELAADLMRRGTLIAPVKEKAGFVFREISDAGRVDLNFYNTLMSPKSAFFPPTEDFVRYDKSKTVLDAEGVEPDLKPVFLLGVRPCDVKSFQIMDIHFSDTAPADPYWKKRREAATIFGYAFDVDAPADAADFYSTLKIGAADPEGSDIFMIKKGDQLLLKAVTPKGGSLLSSLNGLAQAGAEDEKYFDDYVARGRNFKTRHACVEDGVIAKKLEDLFHKTEFWEKISDACLSCGACTFVCPTCYCFDICDETLFGKGIRRRVWDACMFTDFTLEASGHNPRTKVYQRLRQKICHKYSFHVRKYGVISCVGCGRCTRNCPVNIDIFSIVEKALKT